MAYRRDTPRYQRARQQLNALPQHIQAVLNVRALDPILEDEARNRLAFRGQAADIAFQKQRLKQGDDRYQLAQKQQKYGEKMDLWSNVLAGVGVPVAGYSGYLGMKERQQLAADYRNMLARR
jgi:hypothetical protein